MVVTPVSKWMCFPTQHIESMTLTFPFLPLFLLYKRKKKSWLPNWRAQNKTTELNSLPLLYLLASSGDTSAVVVCHPLCGVRRMIFWFWSHERLLSLTTYYSPLLAPSHCSWPVWQLNSSQSQTPAWYTKVESFIFQFLKLLVSLIFSTVLERSLVITFRQADLRAWKGWGLTNRGSQIPKTNFHQHRRFTSNIQLYSLKKFYLVSK